MGIDWHMCDVCGECKVEYDFSGIDIINIIESVSVCEECFEDMKRRKKIKVVKKDDNEWMARKAFDIIDKKRKPVSLLEKGKTKYDKKKPLEK